MKQIILIVSFVLNFGIILGQSQAGQTTIPIPSSNSLDLGRYIETPVSQFTGIPDISIPLYSLKGKDIELPISLNYHPGGVMPEIHPGWTGQGWSIQAGGAIIRKQNSLADEKRLQNLNVGYFWERDFLNNVQPWPDSINTKTNIESLINKVCDFEPDEFYFNFLGIHGVFYLDQTGKWRVQSDRNITVYFDENTGFMPLRETFGTNWILYPLSPHFYKFTLIDEGGNQYTFGGDENSIEFSSSASDRGGDGLTATTWYLTKVVSANESDVFNLKYERGPHTVQLFWILNNLSISDLGGNTNVSGRINPTLSGAFTSPVYLNKIVLNDSTQINFHTSACGNLKYRKEFLTTLYEETYGTPYRPQYSFEILDNNDINIPFYSGKTFSDKLDKIIWLKLDSLTVSNQNRHVIKKAAFNYNTSENERQFLESLNISGQNSSNFQQYSFHYNERNKLYGFLDTYTDHWGYNNGKIISPNSNDYSILREPDSNYVYAGILDTIYHPTGGKTSFLYEVNAYGKVVSFNKRDSTEVEEGTSSGLRIRSIKSYDLNGNIHEKTYQYNSCFSPTCQTSSGILYNKPNYINYAFALVGTGGLSSYIYVKALLGDIFSIANIVSSVIASTSPQEVQFIALERQSMPSLPLSEFTTTNVTYSIVTEHETYNGLNIGHIVSKFSNHDNGYFDLNPLILYARIPSMDNPSSSRSFERGKLIQKISYNNNLEIVQRVENEWNRYINFGHEIRSYLFDQFSSPTYFYISTVAYLKFDYPFLLTEQRVYDYDDDDNVTTSITKYGYNSNKQIIRTEKSLGDGSSLIEKRRYADDFVGQYSSGTLPEWTTLRNMATSGMVAYPIEEYKMHKSNIGNKSIVNSEIYIYKDTLSKKLLKSFYQLNSASPIDSSSYIPLSISPYSSSVTMDPRIVNVERYSYNDKGLLKEITERDGNKSVYLWGYNNMYPIAKINNSSYSNVEEALGIYEVSRLAHSFPKRYEIEHLSNTLRSSSLLSNSLITSYSYIPQIGMDMMILPNGIKTQYSYDGFSRLNTVRDNSSKIVERILYHYQNNNDFEGTPGVHTAPSTCVLSYTRSDGGSISATSRIVETNTSINLNTELPVLVYSGYEFDGYYVNGIKIINPTSYTVQSNATINARFTPVAQDFYVTVMLGSEQLIESSYSVEIQSSTGPTIASQIIKPDDPELSSLVNNNNFPVTITITTRALLPSLRITVDGIIVFDNYYGNVPSGYSFTTDPLNSGAHTVTIETP